MRDLFDPNPELRTEAEWRELLAGLVSLSRFTGVEVVATMCCCSPAGIAYLGRAGLGWCR
jgi:hypothetical protein